MTTEIKASWASNNEVKYVHLRKYSWDVGGPLHAHIHGPSRASKGGATLAYKITDKGVLIGIAKCSDDDAFVKATGRDIASSRLGQFVFPSGFDVRNLEGLLSSFLVAAV